MAGKIYTGTTVQQGARLTGNLPANYIIRDVHDKILVAEPYMYPLSQILFLQKRSKHTTAHPLGKYEWIEGELLWDEDTLVEAVTGGSTTATAKVSTASLFVVGMTVMFEETREVGLVTNVNTGTGTLTITRAGSGNFANVTAGTKIKIIGTAFSEISTVPEAVSNYDNFRYTYTQIFKKSWKFSDRMIASTKAGGTYGGNQKVETIRRRGLEFRKDIEKSFWFNEEPYAVSSSGAYTTFTAGVIWQIQNNGGRDETYTGVLDEDTLDGILNSLTIGSPYKTAFCGKNVSNAIEKIIKKRWNITNPIKKYGVTQDAPALRVVQYDTNNVSLEVITCPLFTDQYADWCIILDLDNIELVEFAPDEKGQRRLRAEEGLEDNNATVRVGQLLADVGIAVKNTATHTIIRPRT